MVQVILLLLLQIAPQSLLTIKELLTTEKFQLFADMWRSHIGNYITVSCSTHTQILTVKLHNLCCHFPKNYLLKFAFSIPIGLRLQEILIHSLRVALLLFFTVLASNRSTTRYG